MTLFSLQHKRIWVAGHSGMVGAATVRRLQQENCEILTASRTALDLRRQRDVEEWVDAHKPDIVVLAAAKVGGIVVNRDCPAEFLYDNLLIESNVIHAAYKARVEKLLFLGSSCIYPRKAALPITEEALLTGALEVTNEAYAIAKIAGIKLCQSYRKQYGCDFISVMPCNLYGQGDRFDLNKSHVIPALLMKFHQAKRCGAPKVTLWGTGMPRREFLYVDDLADALVFLLKNYSAPLHINVGSGQEISIKNLGALIAAVTGYEGEIVFDASMPDGVARKLMDNSRINAMGWRAQTTLENGLCQSYRWFLEHQDIQHAA